MKFEVNQKVMIHMPNTVSGKVMHASKLRPYNRKVATITSVAGDHCRLNVDEGKYEWPFSLLAPFVPYGGKPEGHEEDIRNEFKIKKVKSYFEVYFEDQFVSCADTHKEAEEDIEFYMGQIKEVGFAKWRADFLDCRKRLASFKVAM